MADKVELDLLENKSNETETTKDTSLRVDSVLTKKTRRQKDDRDLRMKQDEDLKEKIRSRFRLPKDRISRMLLGMIAATLIAALAGSWIYNRTHLFDSYRVIDSVRENDVEGTRYVMLGDRVLKYGHDGVFCVTTSNSALWSVAYSIQSPICDTCDDYFVIAEQQGKQVFVFDKNGLKGSYQTSMNIRKARVAANGVTAVLMDDGDVSWVNLYSQDGSSIATVRLTMDDSGYPLDIALTPNAKRMIVSSMKTSGRTLCGNALFYDFSSSSSDRHLMQTISYDNLIIPEVYYASGQMPVAVTDSGYIVFSSDKRPSEKVNTVFEKEIISCFHEPDSIGFLFRSDEMDEMYDMEIYNHSGKRIMHTAGSYEYTGVAASKGEILLQDSSHLYICRTSGKQKLDVTYENEVKYFASLKGSRNYLVITDDSMDRIRIE